MKHLFFFIILAAATKINSTAPAVSYMSQPRAAQDKFVNEHFFHNKPNGVFIDIGAHDGKAFSNSYYFEKALGWTGICFEPLAEPFAKLKQNRSCICINACVASTESVVPFIQVQSIELAPEEHPGYNSNMLSGLAANYDQHHYEILQQSNCSYAIVPVPTRNLNSVCKEYNITHVDYLSMDVEGSELDILMSIDYEKIHIQVMTIENNYANPAIRTFLESKHFKYYANLANQDEVYVNTK